MRRETLATVALFLLALLFGWETRQALRATPGGQDNAATAPAESWQPGISAPDPPSPPDPTPIASAVAARPLFRPDRQPFREEAAGVSVQNREAELSRYTLLGVLGFGGAPVGVVVVKGGNKGERWEVKKGDSFQGFKVEEVGMEGLRLKADGKEFLLPLYAGAPSGPVRTEATRRDAGQPGTAQRAAPPASASGTAVPAGRSAPGVPPSPASASSPPVPGRPRWPVAANPSATGGSPAVAPRTTPGTR